MIYIIIYCIKDAGWMVFCQRQHSNDDREIGQLQAPSSVVQHPLLVQKQTSLKRPVVWFSIPQKQTSFKLPVPGSASPSCTEIDQLQMASSWFSIPLLYRNRPASSGQFCGSAYPSCTEIDQLQMASSVVQRTLFYSCVCVFNPFPANKFVLVDAVSLQE